MNSQSSFKIEQAPIFSGLNENNLKVNLRKESPEHNHDEEEEDSEAKRISNSLNPALNKRIRQPKKIEDQRKQAVIRVKKGLNQMNNNSGQ